MNKFKQQGTCREKIFLLSASFISTIFISRNMYRILTFSKSYYSTKKLMAQHFSFQQVIQNVKQNKSQVTLMLQAVSPKFLPQYFKSIEDPAKYSKKVGKFYEGLTFQNGFQGVFRSKGREHIIWFKMNKPIVSYQIASAARYLDERKKNFHSLQLISLIGQLRYSKERKKGEFNTKMLVLDGIQVDKYWQTKIFATLLSSFYFGLILGCCFSILSKRNIEQISTLEDVLQKTKKKATIFPKDKDCIE